MSGSAHELTVTREVEKAIVPLLVRDGFDLVLCEYVPRQHILRLYIDRLADLEGGVTVDDCAKVSRTVGDLLDAEGVSDKIPGRYHLEVSSPGLDRPLTRPRDFQRFVGKPVQVTTKNAVGNRKKFPGRLEAADDLGIEVVVDGTQYAIPYADIDKARLVPEF